MRYWWIKTEFYLDLRWSWRNYCVVDRKNGNSWFYSILSYSIWVLVMNSAIWLKRKDDRVEEWWLLFHGLRGTQSNITERSLCLSNHHVHSFFLQQNTFQLYKRIHMQIKTQQIKQKHFIKQQHLIRRIQRDRRSIDLLVRTHNIFRLLQNVHSFLMSQFFLSTDSNIHIATFYRIENNSNDIHTVTRNGNGIDTLQSLHLTNILVNITQQGGIGYQYILFPWFSCCYEYIGICGDQWDHDFTDIGHLRLDLLRDFIDNFLSFSDSRLMMNMDLRPPHRERIAVPSSRRWNTRPSHEHEHHCNHRHPWSHLLFHSMRESNRTNGMDLILSAFRHLVRQRADSLIANAETYRAIQHKTLFIPTQMIIRATRIPAAGSAHHHLRLIAPRERFEYLNHMFNTMPTKATMEAMASALWCQALAITTYWYRNDEDWVPGCWSSCQSDKRTRKDPHWRPRRWWRHREQATKFISGRNRQHTASTIVSSWANNLDRES